MHTDTSHMCTPHLHLSSHCLPIRHCRISAAGNCTDRMTSCRACYFAQVERALSSQCSTDLQRYRCADLTGHKRNKCLKRWGNCVRSAFKDLHGQVWQYSTDSSTGIYCLWCACIYKLTVYTIYENLLMFDLSDIATIWNALRTRCSSSDMW